MVFLNFYLYKRPLKFNKYFQIRSLTISFLVGWFLVAFFCLINRSIGVLYNIYEDVNPNKATLGVWIDGLSHVIKAFLVVPYVIMNVFFVLAVTLICTYGKKQVLKGASYANQRKQLISVLIYCAPPNVLNSPNFVISVILIIYLISGDENLLQLKIKLDSVERYCVQFRMIIITICTFSAFEHYRKLVISWMFWRTKKISTTVMVVPTRSSFSVSR